MSIAPGMLLRLLGLAIPLLVGVGVWLFVRRRRRVASALGDRRIASRLTGTDLGRIPWTRIGLVLAAATALAVAVALSHWGLDPNDAAASGGPVVLVVDVSSSMLAADVGSNRLTVARALLRDVTSRLSGRAIGIVAFAGQAAALTAPTLDPGAVDLYMEALDPAMVTQSGSAVVSAVRQGLSLLVSGGGEGGTIVLVTDGDGVDDPAEGERIAALAGRAGIPVITVGVGTVTGAPVPDVDFRTGRQTGFKREPDGRVATSRLNEPLLRTIAEESGGIYLSASDPATADRLLAALADEPAAADTQEDGDGAPGYAWFAAGALLLLALESLGRRFAPEVFT